MSFTNLSSNDSLPHYSVNLKSLQNQSASVSARKDSVKRLSKNSLKVKVNYEKLKAVQAFPIISPISKMLISGVIDKSSPVGRYAAELKDQNRNKKKAIKTNGKIDYSKVKSLSYFAISKQQFDAKPPKSSFSVLEYNAETEPKGKNEGKDMYAKGQKFIKLKEKNREMRKKAADNKTSRICTFSPDLLKDTNLPQAQSSRASCMTVRSSYKSLSPHQQEFAYVEGCDMQNLVEKFSPRPVCLTIKIPNP